MIWLGIAFVGVFIAGLAILEFLPSSRLAQSIDGALSFWGGSDLASYNKLAELSASDVALIEKRLTALRSVVVLCSRVDEPNLEFKKAVLDNFAEGVAYTFFVSNDNANSDQLRRYREIFVHLHAAVCTATHSGEAKAAGASCLDFSDAFRIRVLPLEWANVPYLFYTFVDPNGSAFLIAYKGTEVGVGIARSYLRVDETEARAILDLCAAASVDLEQAFEAEAYEIVEELPSDDPSNVVSLVRARKN